MSKSVWESTSEFFKEEYRNLVRFVKNSIADTADRDSEDIVQEVALHLFEKADVTAPIEHLTSYVYQALRNKVIDYFRRQKNMISLSTPVGDEDESVVLEDILEDEREDLLKTIEDRQLADQVMKVIQTIEIRQAAIFIATEIDGCSFKELADEWQVPIGTLLSLKSRAVRRIHEKLENIF
jgi:RNA polymerase sigma factor (sigma-70 family)